MRDYTQLLSIHIQLTTRLTPQVNIPFGLHVVNLKLAQDPELWQLYHWSKCSEWSDSHSFRSWIHHQVLGYAWLNQCQAQTRLGFWTTNDRIRQSHSMILVLCCTEVVQPGHWCCDLPREKVCTTEGSHLYIWMHRHEDTWLRSVQCEVCPFSSTFEANLYPSCSIMHYILKD